MNEYYTKTGESVFHDFGKGNNFLNVPSKNCVIYTRVSTKEQADNNLSLDIQKKACDNYAIRNNFEVKGYYGGTYESAKTDERNEFNKMLADVKRCKEKISHIIVYSVDRFSRSGANAIFIAQQLKEKGIAVVSVTQPGDSLTASGGLQQNIQFIFSEYENQQRREKCMAGIKEMLLRGEWCTKPPMGYDIVKINGSRSIRVNEKGKLLRKAFIWKARERITNEEILKRLSLQGLQIYSQRLSEIFRNPFYCGMLAHTALEGDVVKGNHEPLVSKALFLEVNGLISNKKQGLRQRAENDETPLKRFLKCENCGEFLRAYRAAKNGKYYYKCNTVGCCCNIRADSLHENFEYFLSQHSLVTDVAIYDLLQQQLIACYNQQNLEHSDEHVYLEKQMHEVSERLERVEEKYMLDEIDKEVFDKYRIKYDTKIKKIKARIADVSIKTLNKEVDIQLAMTLASRLNNLWCAADNVTRQRLQFLIFPEGGYYNKKNESCRIPKVNPLFRISGKGLDTDKFHLKSKF